MFTVGIVLVVFALLATALKFEQVWNAAHDLHNGGGAPTLDLVIFYPLFWLLGVGVVVVGAKWLTAPQVMGFACSGYLLLALVFWFCLRYAYRHGERVLKRGIEQRTHQTNDHPPM
jgi:hypothetical protein